MRVVRRLAALAGAGIAALLLLGWPSRAEEPVASPVELTLIYSSNLEGEIEPCGCTEGMLGGLARRASIIAQARKGAAPLLLDAGDLHFRRQPIPEILRPQLLLKAETIARLYSTLEYDAVVSGELERAVGEEGVRRIAAASARRPLSIEEGLLVREVGGLRIGIVGIGHGERAEDLVAAIPRRETDLLVCVSHLGLEGDKRLAAMAPHLDVIVGGHDAVMLPTPVREGRTLILQAGSLGRFLGRLTLHLRSDWRAQDLVDASENERWAELAAEYDAAVERFRRERDVAPTLGDRERAQARIEQYQKEAAEAHARVRDLSDRSWFANRLIPLDARVPDDPEVARAVEAYKRQVRDLNERLAEVAAAAAKEGPAYLGGSSCVACHTREHESWSSTPHAHAYETLVKRGQEFDLECIGCHTTAFQEKGGFFLPTKVGAWKGVQCEACHGPGEGHPPRKLVVTPSPATCVRCHQPPQQEGFDYGGSLTKTRHAK